MLPSDPVVLWSQLALTWATVRISSQLCAQRLWSSRLEAWNWISRKYLHHGNQQMLQLRAFGGGGIVSPGQYWPDQKIQNRVIRYELVFYLHNDKISISYVFSSSHVWMWELDHKESWAWKNGCFWTVVLEKTLESPLDCKEIQRVHPKGDQSRVFIGRTDAEAETLILWPPDAKNWLIRKDLDVGKDWRQEENRLTEDEMVGWHHQFNGPEFEQAPGVGEGQGSLACCSSWGCEESNTTERLNWTEPFQ